MRPLRVATTIVAKEALHRRLRIDHVRIQRRVDDAQAHVMEICLQLSLCKHAARARPLLDDFGDLLELEIPIGSEIIPAPSMFSAIGLDGVIEHLSEVGDLETIGPWNMNRV